MFRPGSSQKSIREHPLQLRSTMFNPVNSRSKIVVLSLVVLVCTYTIYLVASGEHEALLDKATVWQQETLCRDRSQAQGPVTAIQAKLLPEHVLDRYNNRMACDLCQPDDEFCLAIGEHNIAQSVGYEGSNFRLERLFHKLQNGQPITVSVVGGSNSAGHGLFYDGWPDEYASPGNMHYRVYEWIKERFPHEGHRFVNGAIPGATTDLFAFCFPEQIPEESDLVLVEFAVNDPLLTSSAVSYERLLRGLMDLPNKPAVINLNVFSLTFATIGLGETQHQAVAHYYDTPVISIRNLLLPGMFKNASTIPDWFFVGNENGKQIIDTRHIAFAAHKTMANLTATYMSRVLCKMEERERLKEIGIDLRRSRPEFPAWDELGEIPKWPLMSQYKADAPPMPKLSPICLSTTSKKNPLKQQTDGDWVEWSWKDKKYIVGRKPGEKVQFKFKTVVGTVALFYQRSRKYGLGVARCWVDDDTDRMMYLDGYWEHDVSIPDMTEVRGDLEEGEHVLNCEINVDTNDPGGGTEFRITTLVA
ncbi:hypothetical protein FFLO_02107 [Filobasidium floriforme]|uniref:Uncharacterized protein n=1 Tax=Filobasidium floriforme TaxID=5210 RepID=A0A8K0JNB6_9TREE|nr:hypothetical protein FFLO_02107 [Filobasidium floriforme]